MTTLARRSGGPVAEMLDWLESGTGLGLRGLGLASTLRVEDYFEDDMYVVRAELPGVDPEKDVEIFIDGDLLTIRGERREERKERNRHEFHYGSFSRSVTIPRDVQAEQVQATYTDGVLEIRIPTTSEQHEPRKIPVQRRG